MYTPVDLWRSKSTIEAVLNHPVQTGKVLLYGSSFFTHWGYDRAKTQLSCASGGKLLVLNHGFGGATIDELLYHYPRLVVPYDPSAVVIRSSYNDIAKGMTVEETLSQLKQLVHWLRTDFPHIPIFLLPVFDAKIMTDERHAAFAELNQQMAAFAADTDHVEIFDLNPFFYENDAQIGDLRKLRDVFVPDGLHLTDSAYEEMAEFFAPRLLTALENT